MFYEYCPFSLNTVIANVLSVHSVGQGRNSPFRLIMECIVHDDAKNTLNVSIDTVNALQKIGLPYNDKITKPAVTLNVMPVFLFSGGIYE